MKCFTVSAQVLCDVSDWNQQRSWMGKRNHINQGINKKPHTLTQKHGLDTHTQKNYQNNKTALQLLPQPVTNDLSKQYTHTVANKTVKSEKHIPLCARKAWAFQLVWVEAWHSITGLVGLMVGKGQLERGSLFVWVCVCFFIPTTTSVLNELPGVSLPLLIVLGPWWLF